MCQVAAGPSCSKAHAAGAAAGSSRQALGPPARALGPGSCSHQPGAPAGLVPGSQALLRPESREPSHTEAFGRLSPQGGGCPGSPRPYTLRGGGPQTLGGGPCPQPAEASTRLPVPPPLRAGPASSLLLAQVPVTQKPRISRGPETDPKSSRLRPQGCCPRAGQHGPPTCRRAQGWPGSRLPRDQQAPGARLGALTFLSAGFQAQALNVCCGHRVPRELGWAPVGMAALCGPSCWHCTAWSCPPRGSCPL